MKDFFSHYNQLTKQEQKKFRRKIMLACSIERPTFYSWLRRQKVAKQSKILIAQELNQPIETLFPN